MKSLNFAPSLCFGSHHRAVSECMNSCVWWQGKKCADSAACGPGADEHTSILELAQSKTPSNTCRAVVEPLSNSLSTDLVLWSVIMQMEPQSEITQGLLSVLLELVFLLQSQNRLKNIPLYWSVSPNFIAFIFITK